MKSTPRYTPLKRSNPVLNFRRVGRWVSSVTLTTVHPPSFGAWTPLRRSQTNVTHAPTWRRSHLA